MRQTRLDTGPGTPDPTVANWHIVRRSWLSATAFGQHGWCRIKPFLQRLIDDAGLSQTTPDMVAGIAAHEEVQSAVEATAPPVDPDATWESALEDGSFLVANEVPLKDARRRLRGIADIVFTHQGVAHILELKNMRPPRDASSDWSVPVWHEHALQTHFYGLLARPLIGEARLAVTYLKGVPKAAFLSSLIAERDPSTALPALFERSAKLPTTSTTIADLGDRIRAFRKDEKRPLLPDPGHDDPDRCAGCRLRAWCPQRRDEPGTFETIQSFDGMQAKGRSLPFQKG